MTLDISKINIPKHPGIYLMKDVNDNIIYIGKAKNLKKRACRLSATPEATM